MKSPARSETSTSSLGTLGAGAGVSFPEWMTHFHAVRNFVTGFPWTAVRTHQSPEHMPQRKRATGGFRYAR